MTLHSFHMPVVSPHQFETSACVESKDANSSIQVHHGVNIEAKLQGRANLAIEDVSGLEVSNVIRHQVMAEPEHCSGKLHTDELATVRL